MSHSLLFKQLIYKKVEKDYVYIIYKKEEKQNIKTITAIDTCEKHSVTMQKCINYNIDEFYEKYIISNELLKTLHSNKNLNVKYDAINFEYNKIFKIDNYNFKIEYRIVKKKSAILKHIKTRIENNKKRITNKQKLYNLQDYTEFYNNSKNIIENIEDKCGPFICYI